MTDEDEEYFHTRKLKYKQQQIEIWQGIKERPIVYQNVKRMDIENLITDVL